MRRERGRAPRGIAVQAVKRGRLYRRLNVVAALRGGRVTAPFCYTGSTTAAVFENWFSNSLLPGIPKGSTVIMDNAPFHRKSRLTELAKSAKARILFLPPYSPDFNPIEQTWANLKRWLCDNSSSFPTLEGAIYAYFHR